MLSFQQPLELLEKLKTSLTLSQLILLRQQLILMVMDMV